jgi:hypothetical protein
VGGCNVLECIEVSILSGNKVGMQKKSRFIIHHFFSTIENGRCIMDLLLIINKSFIWFFWILSNAVDILLFDKNSTFVVTRFGSNA